MPSSPLPLQRSQQCSSCDKNSWHPLALEQQALLPSQPQDSATGGAARPHKGSSRPLFSRARILVQLHMMPGGCSSLLPCPAPSFNVSPRRQRTPPLSDSWQTALAREPDGHHFRCSGFGSFDFTRNHSHDVVTRFWCFT